LLHVVPEGASVEDVTATLRDAEVANHLVGVVSRHVLPKDCLVTGEVAVADLEALAKRAVTVIFSVLDNGSYLLLHLASPAVAADGASHPWAVTSVSSDPTGNAVVFGCADGSIGVTRVDAHSSISWLPKAESAINAVAVSAGGRSALVAAGCSIGVYDLVRKSRVQLLRGHARTVRCMAYIGEDRAISGGDDTHLRIWRIDGGDEIRELVGHAWGITSVCASSVNRIAITSSSSGSLRQWDLDSGRCRGRSMVVDRAEVCVLAADCLCHRVAFGSSDGYVGVHEPESGRLAVRRMHAGTVSGIALLMDVGVVMSCGWDGRLAMYEPDRASKSQHFEDYGCGLGGLCLAPDIRLGLLAGWDGSIGIWDVGRRSFRESRFVFEGPTELSPYRSGPNTQRISPLTPTP
jgi:WD40 repeat protein